MKRDLTKMDVRILEVLWESKEPLSYSQIVEVEPSLNVNTVQAQLRKLLKQGLIHVADVGYSGTVLCRNYEASCTKEELLTANYLEELSQLEERPTASSLVCKLLDMEGSKEKKAQEIKALEDMLESYKRGI